MIAQKDIDVINQDIRWHRNNPGLSGCSSSFENGFVCGLKQARSLLRKIKNLQQPKKEDRNKRVALGHIERRKYRRVPRNSGPPLTSGHNPGAF